MHTLRQLNDKTYIEFNIQVREKSHALRGQNRLICGKYSIAILIELPVIFTITGKQTLKLLGSKYSTDMPLCISSGNEGIQNAEFHRLPFVDEIFDPLYEPICATNKRLCIFPMNLHAHTTWKWKMESLLCSNSIFEKWNCMLGRLKLEEIIG